MRSRGEAGTATLTAESMAERFGVVKGTYASVPLPRINAYMVQGPLSLHINVLLLVQPATCTARLSAASSADSLSGAVSQLLPPCAGQVRARRAAQQRAAAGAGTAAARTGVAGGARQHAGTWPGLLLGWCSGRFCCARLSVIT